MADLYLIKCTCGYTEAKAKYYEKDSMYSSHAIWTFSKMKYEKNRVEKPGYMSLTDALHEAKLFCSECGDKIKEEQFFLLNT